MECPCCRGEFVLGSGLNCGGGCSGVAGGCSVVRGGVGEDRNTSCEDLE